MKIREFIAQEIDIDICDNVIDDYYCAFVGPQELTEEGEKKFSDVLDMEIEWKEGDDIAIVQLPEHGDEWKKPRKEAKNFFAAVAGYCAYEDWNKWFKEEE